MPTEADKDRKTLKRLAVAQLAVSTMRLIMEGWRLLKSAVAG